MGKSMPILYVGVDLAKNVFPVHEVNEAGNFLRAFPSPGDGSVALRFILTSPSVALRR